jgi:two-component system, NtrC family, sensor kinase
MVFIFLGVVCQAQLSFRVVGQGGPGVAGAWRIRHKLMLGLGLVVAIIALLLLGTYKGLASYLATVKTMDSKVSELKAAYELKNAIAIMAASSKLDDPNDQDSTDSRTDFASHKTLTDLENDFVTKVNSAKSALSDYEKQLLDTLERRRDPDNGYELSIIVNSLYDDFEQLNKSINRDFAKMKNGEANPNGQKPTHFSASFYSAIDNLVRKSDELLKGIYESLYKRIEKAKVQNRQSMWIVGTTSAVGVILMITLLRFFYGWVFYPVRDLERGAGRVAQGDFEHRIEVHSGDEMEDLAAAFNNMTSRLRDMYRDLARQVNERSRQLVRSERLAGVGFLAAGVAHEINNPLASIAFCSEALETRLADLMQPPAKAYGLKLRLETGADRDQNWEVVVKYLKMIQDEAFRCKEITERLLEFSRTGERRREQTNLAELVQSVLDMVQHLQNRKGKEIEFKPAYPIRAWVNTQEIKSVVLNLIVNSLDSMDEGGTLTIALHQHHDMAEMVFADTGCGMGAEVLENIFEPFFTRSRTGKGTGLGLTITHRIITQHGGEIEAASPGVNEGSTFTVRLPMKPSEDQEATSRSAESGIKGLEEEARDVISGKIRREAA